MSALVVVVGFFLAAAFWPVDVPEKATERFTATWIDDIDNQASALEFVIQRRSTESERQHLLDSLQQTGSEQLLKAIQTLPSVGYIRDGKGAEYDLHYVYGVTSEDGTERVTLATDQGPHFNAGEERPSSGDPVTLIELRVNNEGEGHGKLSLVTERPDNRGQRPSTLEDYDVQPLYRLRVKRQGTTR